MLVPRSRPLAPPPKTAVQAYCSPATHLHLLEGHLPHGGAVVLLPVLTRARQRNLKPPACDICRCHGARKEGLLMGAQQPRPLECT